MPSSQRSIGASGGWKLLSWGAPIGIPTNVLFEMCYGIAKPGHRKMPPSWPPFLALDVNSAARLNCLPAAHADALKRSCWRTRKRAFGPPDKENSQYARLIPSLIDQNSCAQSRKAMDMILHG